MEKNSKLSNRIDWLGVTTLVVASYREAIQKGAVLFAPVFIRGYVYTLPIYFDSKGKMWANKPRKKRVEVAPNQWETSNEVVIDVYAVQKTDGIYFALKPVSLSVEQHENILK